MDTDAAPRHDRREYSKPSSTFFRIRGSKRSACRAQKAPAGVQRSVSAACPSWSRPRQNSLSILRRVATGFQHHLRCPPAPSLNACGTYCANYQLWNPNLFRNCTSDWSPYRNSRDSMSQGYRSRRIFDGVWRRPLAQAAADRTISQIENAQHCRSLHKASNPLFLYNVWDAGSAIAVARAGSKAVATSSWSVAAAQGEADGQQLPFEEMPAVVMRIAKPMKLPVTVDFEGGYAADPKTVGQNVRRLLELGIVGFNYETRSWMASASMVFRIRLLGYPRLAIQPILPLFQPSSIPGQASS